MFLFWGHFRSIVLLLFPLISYSQVAWIGNSVKLPIKKTTIDIVFQTRGNNLAIGEIGATRPLMKNISLRIVFRKYFPEKYRVASDFKVKFPGKWFNSYRLRFQYVLSGAPMVRHRWTTGIKLGAFSPFMSHETNFNLISGRYTRYRVMGGLNVKHSGAVMGLFYGFQLDEVKTHIIGLMWFFKM